MPESLVPTVSRPVVLVVWNTTAKCRLLVSDEKTKRGRGRPKGTPASETQRAASKTNVKKAHKAIAERKAKRQQVEEKPRWKKLEDGDINMRDLTLDELVKGEVANNDGSWEGRRHTFDVRWQQRLNAEYKRRIRNGIDKLAPLALEALEELLEDGDAPAQRAAMVKMVLEYQVGKVPDVVHVGVENEFDKLQQTAFRIVRGTGAITGGEDTTPEQDIHEAELVEE